MWELVLFFLLKRLEEANNFGPAIEAPPVGCRVQDESAKVLEHREFWEFWIQLYCACL